MMIIPTWRNCVAGNLQGISRNSSQQCKSPCFKSGNPDSHRLIHSSPRCRPLAVRHTGWRNCTATSSHSVFSSSYLHRASSRRNLDRASYIGLPLLSPSRRRPQRWLQSVTLALPLAVRTLLPMVQAPHETMLSLPLQPLATTATWTMHTSRAFDKSFHLM